VGSNVIDTQHTVEPVPTRGGLRRLRRGELESNGGSGETLVGRARFLAALEAEMRRALLDDHTLAVAAIRIRPLPGTALSDPRSADLPAELLTRVRSVNGNIRVSFRDDDQLLVLIPSIRRRPDGEIAVHQLLEVLDIPVPVDGLDHHLTPLIGAAMLDLDNPSADLLLSGAELALAECDRLHPAMMFHPYQRVRQERREQMRHDLQQAVITERIEVALQPAFDLLTGSLVAVEAFARWPRPDRGPVPPLEFVPLAAELGVDHLVTSQVLNRAVELVARAGRRQPSAFRPITLWLNVSPDEIAHPDFASLVQGAAAGHPEVTMGIEVSPSPSADDREAHHLLRRLAADGTRTAIGDFGIGNANLTVVPRLAFDAVKIDRALVRQIAGNRDAAAMVEFLVRLADQLQLETTAQGIESDAQLAVVTSAGCSVGQGYHFAAPTSDVEAIERWFRR
jgi:EAL domain-containing protein (putative c-di-GMP-specific phosphodiesterase class I)